ncbi:hypothetical protein SDC9_98393 [bioreactor metagenome]|uniref:Uncharacterized protein n=1 Tax=bioreactor metagenome TaxID=1076179 RepID=A0A645AEL8_9ZZZZ
MAFGGAGGSTAAVTACPSPDQDDHITFHGSLSSHESLSSRTDDKAELKVLGDKVRVIDLLDKTGGKTNLVSIRTVAQGRALGDDTLGQLSLQGFRNGGTRVCTAADTHCLIHISTGGKGVANRSSYTGGCSSERFDLGWMIVCLILEQQQGGNHTLIGLHIDLDGTGIDFL